MVELSLEQIIKLRDDTKRYKERKEAELNDIPTGVRSRAITARMRRFYRCLSKD